MYVCEWERVCKSLVCRGAMCVSVWKCVLEKEGGWGREREREREREVGGRAGGGGWVWAWRRLAQMVFAVRAPHIGWASTLGCTTALQRKRSRGRGGGGGTTDWAALAEIHASSDAHRNRIQGFSALFPLDFILLCKILSGLHAVEVAAARFSAEVIWPFFPPKISPGLFGFRSLAVGVGN